MPFDAVVLAGTSARRLDGADKAMAEVAGIPLLEWVLRALSAARHVVVVGPPRATDRDVEWVTETPPGGGPVAALCAGLDRTAGDVVVVLATDLPFVEGDTVATLLDAVGARDGAILVDGHGRDQPLAAAYRSVALRERLRALPEIAGAAMTAVVGSMTLARVEAARAARDCDTWDEILAASRELRR